ncbi:Protein Y73B6BL.16 [Aphelenchoides avenae]|nr:Protein Y73B6BL.16 [Aphelenchus avenae]
MPESQDDGHDTQVVTDIVTKCGVLDSCLTEQSHRFGAVKKGENKNRILKIPFTSKEARDKFIRNFWSSYKDPDFNKFYQGLYVRRDLTPSELSLHQSLRSEAYRKNQDCGEFRYVYRDLRIVELKNPKPLKTHT